MMHNGRSLSGERWSMHCPCCKPLARRRGAKRFRKSLASVLRQRERRTWQQDN